MINVVVACYKKNIDFVYRIKDVNVLVYDKENPENPLTVPVNKGNEASSFLKYIVDYYDKLPEFTYFIHDDEYAWHHTGSVIDKFYEAVESGQKYYNINDQCHWDRKNMIKPEQYTLLIKWYMEYVDKYIPLEKIPNNDDFIYGYYGAAQFLIHRDLILSLPKKFYEDIYAWILATDLPTWLSSRFLEWTWHIFWVIYPNLLKD